MLQGQHLIIPISQKSIWILATSVQMSAQVLGRCKEVLAGVWFVGASQCEGSPQPQSDQPRSRVSHVAFTAML